MTLDELMKLDDMSVRITIGRSWLYFDNDSQMWVVRHQKPYKKNAVIITTRLLGTAIDRLIEAEK